jgi:cyclophilin family peptidyl-prolyl cis-trans isomerase
MQQRFNVSASARTLGAAAVTTLLLAALSACGGSGSDGATATVSSMSIAATKYGAPAQVTVVGTNLGNLNLQASGCKNVTRLTASPTASTDTTAYFSCTPSGAYTSQILAVSNGGTITQQTLTVLPPVVTMAVSGGPSGSINGTIVFNLKGNVAPITVDNFLAYVNSGTSPTNGFYAGTIFHRVVDFNNPQAGPEYDVVQGGTYGAATSGTLPAPKTGTLAPIALETAGGTNVQWTAAMARTSDVNSATSGFFFNIKNNTSAFDTTSGPGYAVFADVSGSATILNQIAAIAQGGTSVCPTLVGISDGSCVPVPNVTVTSVAQTQ